MRDLFCKPETTRSGIKDIPTKRVKDKETWTTSSSCETNTTCAIFNFTSTDPRVHDTGLEPDNI